MKWRLILSLSALGFAMSIAELLLTPSLIEVFAWAAIFIFSAILIAKNVSSKYFLHGFVLGGICYILHSLCSTIFSVATDHDAPWSALVKIPSTNIRLKVWQLMLITDPLFIVAFGLVLGVFTMIASKVTTGKSVQLG